jgi:thiamine-monophosphate kinase
MPTIRELGEDALVQQIIASLPQDERVLLGPGDDCAVVRGSENAQLLKVDAIVQDVHFTLDTEPRLIGRKALARAISDIAAMGGIPEHALVTLILPPETEASFVQQLYLGMSAIAARYEINIVGGETSRGTQMVISVALTGSASHWIRRSGGSVGDVLLVTGRLGGSIARHHLTFEPRLQQALWLGQYHRPTAMMDISDGLAKDLPRMAAACGVDFRVDVVALPCNAGCSPQRAWTDGEDYELLFAINEARVESLIHDWANAFPTVPLTIIGKLVAIGEGNAHQLAAGGWDHFA